MERAAQPHVLLVEDSELVTDALSILLESTGARVSIARSVADALRMGERDPATLVLLDLTLPDGDGLRAVEPLRDAGARTIVALTGRDDPETVRQCTEAGCADVLVKPVPARELIAKVAGWLEPRP